MIGQKTKAGVVAAALLLATTGAAAQPPSQKRLALPPKLRSALMAEMIAVRQGVSEIAASLGSGEWEIAARRAERIRDSFILRQKLPSTDLEALERSLPRDFLERDASFHAQADGLARAARARDYRLAVMHFSRMLDGCADCHTRYAADVLPGFRSAKRPGA